MNTASEYVVESQYVNGQDITKGNLNEVLVRNNYIHIKLCDEHQSPNIYIPDEALFTGGIIYNIQRKFQSICI